MTNKSLNELVRFMNSQSVFILFTEAFSRKVFVFSSLTFIILSFVGCKTSPDTLFVLQEKEDTGIDFSNTISESDSFNIFTYEYIYNGGGVAVADFDNDGLQDIFFSGNMVPNKLYLNKGGLKFADVTETANVNKPDKWNSGVAVVDINNDGWQDIYVCSTMKKDSLLRKNMLFLNKGLNENKIPIFEEVAEQYGIADDGHSMMASFFDYDRDGDLDLYILTNKHWNEISSNYIFKIKDGSSPSNDRLYMNNGNGTFTNVTKKAGILIDGYGLGLAISDFNNDGWSDIYVSNDFLTNDILYINNKNGTFTNESPQLLSHQSMFSMGNDAADFNNDGATDVITVDMLPETNERKKTMISNKNYQTYINNDKYGYEYQYMRNMLQVNNGSGLGFSDIGQMAGVHQTEWSWSPLFADFDNDGFKDLAITNGFPKDITDKDFMAYKIDMGGFLTNMDLIDSVPVVKIPNYVFKNNGDLTFSDVSKEWGFVQPSFSNGAAYTDLDNDGDLDYVVNNINQEAFVYKNTLNDRKDKSEQNYLRINLVGTDRNRDAIGAKVTIYLNHGQQQYFENQHERGYLSSVERLIHIGLGKTNLVDSVNIVWPDGSFQQLTSVKSNQILTVKYQPASRIILASAVKALPMFAEVSNVLKVRYKHEEEDRIDYNIQRTLPHKFSQYGPGISAGDVNNDLMDDFILGGSVDNPTMLFTQKKDGTFTQTPINLLKKSEDEGMLLFDADKDNDLDLYVVSGSIEADPGSADYLDLYYRNDGKGKFTLDTLVLPKMQSSGSCVRAADIDADNDLDLFVGGRVVPGSYPLSPESYLLINENGKFTDATKTIAPELVKAGMITDGLFTDFDNDGSIDLVVVGEYLPVTFFKNTKGKFSKVTQTGLEAKLGWWSSITGADFDEDGDIDYVAGNLGKNNSFDVSSTYPLKAFAKDFDGNGSVDAILACHIRESLQNREVKHLYPVHFWDELNSQSPRFRRQFRGYRQYGKSTLEQLFRPGELRDALVLEANFFETSYIENLGGGKFNVTSLPNLVQVGPVNGMVADDFNNDGHLDVMVIGNDFGNEIFVGRYDALTGLILQGDGKGKFNVISSEVSNFIVKGDAKGLAKLYQSSGNPLYVATKNRDSLMIYSKGNVQSEPLFTPEPLDSWAEFILHDGRKLRVEFYYGSGYLSQSSRRVPIPPGTREIIVNDFKGTSRKVTPVFPSL
jgi:enediyne biosynthesis protein E4